VNGDGMITIEEIYGFLESKLKVIRGGRRGVYTKHLFE
jgi:hypothetical protein